MALDPGARRLVDMLKLVGGLPPKTVVERRSALKALTGLAAREVPFQSLGELTIAGPAGPLAARFYDGRPEGHGAALLFFHGGGLVAGDLDTDDGICRGLAKASGALVISVDYRLAPEHPYPAAIEDATASLQWLAACAGRLGIDEARLAVGGNSAGAGLAAILCDEARASGPAIRAQLLLSPVLDLTASLPSRREFATGFLIDADTIAADVAAYNPGAFDLAAPRLSPLFVATPAGLPPTIIHSGECDPMRDEAAAYATRLRQAGVAVNDTCHAGMVHSFFGLNGLLPQAEPALAAAGAELAGMLR